MKVRIRMCWLLIPLVVTTGCREASPDRSAVVYEGFVVWESNRSGAWRIYKQDLGTDETVQRTFTKIVVLSFLHNDAAKICFSF